MPEHESADGLSFKELERQGWGAKADDYDSYAGQVTGGAVEPMLDAAAVGPGARVLDVACGPGYLADAAAARGARAVGVDFAANMVAQAKCRFPRVEFREGDAESLALEAGSFDAVVCGFGLLHIADPERAIGEAYRVLRSGGRYAFTVWVGPPRHEYFALVFQAMQAHANMDVGLPQAPPMFRFSDPVECTRSLEQAGFEDVAVRELPLVWRVPRADMILGFLLKSAVRVGMLLERQTREARERVQRAVLDGAEKFRRGDVYEVGFPAVLAAARKP
jgi:ubiquinone/menaquinone biosynthesis C-methylase UbiE